jgi:hypothetical protein
MQGFFDDFLVGFVLLASVGYAAFSLGPGTLRRRMLVGASALLRHVPTPSSLREMALRLETAAIKAKGLCGGCDNCGSEQQQPPSVQISRSEVRIAVAKIGKRPL